MAIKPIIIIAGGGHKVRYLIDLIKDSFEIFVIDLNKDVLEKLPSYPNIHAIEGDATSDYMLRKARIDEAGYLIAFTDSEEVNYEISILGKRHGVANVISYVPTYKYLDKFSELGVLIVGGPKDIAQFVYNKIAHTKKAIGVGLGIGEIVEIVIDEYSPLANRRLSQIHLKGIRIGAIYRENDLIVPVGTTLVKPGDKLLLIGYPKNLKYALGVILSARVKFPMQYGNTVLGLIFKNKAYLSEIELLKNKTAIQYVKLMTTIKTTEKSSFVDEVEYLQSKDEFLEKISNDIFGMIMIEKCNMDFLTKMGLKVCDFYFVLKGIPEHIPVFVLSGKADYKKMFLYIFEDDEELIRKSIHTSVSIKYTLGIEFDIFVCEQDLKSNDSLTKKVNSIAQRIFSVYKMKHTLNTLKGNPVKVFEKLKRGYDLAVVGGFRRKNTLFKPNPICYIANSSGISVFSILK